MSQERSLKRYMWLVDTIRRHQPVTWPELEEKLIASGQFDTGDIKFSERTFFRDANAIESLFGIVLFFDRKTRGYYIKAASGPKEQHILDWLLHTFRHANVLEVYRDQAAHILLEPAPRGNEHLNAILDGIRKNDILQVELKRFRTFKIVRVPVIPYFIRLFRQEWYLIARDLHKDTVRIFALEKVADITKTGKKFDLPIDEDYPDSATFFRDYFGMSIDEKIPRETITFRAAGDTARHLQQSPLHPSQVETDTDDTGGVTFSVRLHPTADFITEIVRYGKHLKILQPASVQEKVQAFARAVLENYREEGL